MHRMSVNERFWAKVDKGGDCWEWIGARQRYNSYGVIWRDGKNVQAHRLSWELAFGPIPDGMYVCHHCDNRPCVRPDHLFLGTEQDNQLDASRKGRCFGQRPGDDVKRGSRHGYAKLNEDSVRVILAGLATGITQLELGKRFGVGPDCISCIKRGRSWKYLQASLKGEQK